MTDKNDCYLSERDLVGASVCSMFLRHLCNRARKEKLITFSWLALAGLFRTTMTFRGSRNAKFSSHLERLRQGPLLARKVAAREPPLERFDYRGVWLFFFSRYWNRCRRAMCVQKWANRNKLSQCLCFENIIITAAYRWCILNRDITLEWFKAFNRAAKSCPQTT